MRYYGQRDTIVAIATPPGQGGVGIVRVSGPRAREVLSALWGGRPAADSFESHKLYYGPIGIVGTVIDRVLASWMQMPRSYTGEDVVEFSGHGGQAVLRCIVDACCRAGARPAQPGEFTKRAYLNGKIDLVQAEAVADLIGASSEAGMKAAQDQLAGRLSLAVNDIQRRLTELRAFVEATIDFPEEDIEFIRREGVGEKLERIIEDASNLAATFSEGRLVRDGVRVAIAGLPNAGKSSLFNALVGCERVIVHHEPGTTRDVVEQTVSFSGFTFHLRDTAGLRDTMHQVEQSGVRRTKQELDNADVVIYVIDATKGATEEDEKNVSTLPKGKAIMVYSKVDKVSLDFASGTVPIRGQSPPASIGKAMVSALTGRGIDELKRYLLAMVKVSPRTEFEGAVVTNARHKKALDDAIAALREAAHSAAESDPTELVAHHLRQAQGILGRITGETSTEALLDQIFSRFCIGK